MPFVTIHIKYGCDDQALNKVMNEITQAGEDIL